MAVARARSRVPPRRSARTDVRVGEVRTSDTTSYPELTLITGVMDIGQTKAPEVIRATRSKARESAAALTIVDAPPGVSCSTVASIRGADAVLLVTEPTVFGLHDLRLAAELTLSLGLPMGVLVNRSGTGTTDIERFCDEWDVPVVGHLPFERSIAETYARGELVAQTHSQVAEWLGYVATAMRAIASTPPVRVGTREMAGRITMRTIAIASGKGGAGKTTLSALLALRAASTVKTVLADADVEASNLPLALDAHESTRVAFQGGPTASIDPAACTQCGLCEQACRFDAISLCETASSAPALRGRPVGMRGMRPVRAELPVWRDRDESGASWQRLSRRVGWREHRVGRSRARARTSRASS